MGLPCASFPAPFDSIDRNAKIALTSFPRAMLIMAGTFGLWRAGP